MMDRKTITAVLLTSIVTTTLIFGVALGLSAFADQKYREHANGVTTRRRMNGMMNGMMAQSGMMNQCMAMMNDSMEMHQMMNEMMGMMGPVMGGPYDSSVKPIAIDQAIANARRCVASLGNADLAVKLVEEFSNNFYVAVVEKSTGIFAFELLVDRFTGAVHPEPGPNMMWNTKYGYMGMMSSMNSMMGNMMGPVRQKVSEDDARQIAQRFLDNYLPGAKVGETHVFYGYYTIHVLFGGKTQGMLSVNAVDGKVWYHIWHGIFIQDRHL